MSRFSVGILQAPEPAAPEARGISPEDLEAGLEREPHGVRFWRRAIRPARLRP